MSPLYQRWLDLAARRPDEVAVVEAGTGDRHRFGELAERAGAAPKVEAPLVSAARGVGLLLDTLRCWRDGQALLPVERRDAVAPEVLGSLPPDICHLKQTSGTTGTPKLVLFKAAQLAADVDQIVATMRLDAFRQNIGVISLAHSYGFSNLVLPLLLHGIPLVLADSPLPAAVGTALSVAGDGSVLPAVPAMWRAWLDAQILQSSAISLAISAGAPLSAKLERDAFEHCGLKIHNFYGASECGGIAYDRSPTPRHDETLAGTALEGVEVSVAGDRALTVTSAAVAEGYWPAGDTADVLGGGRFRTPDTADIAGGGGQILLRGRRGTSINVAGRKVSPGDIECALGEVAGVRHCLVFGVPSDDPQRVEDIVACLSGDLDAPAARAALLGRLDAWQIPRHWWFRDDLAPDARGKLPRAEWRRRYLER